MFIYIIFLPLVLAQSQWRQVYLDDPKGIITNHRRQIEDSFDEVEFADAGDDYEVGSIWPKPQFEKRSTRIFYTFEPKNFVFKSNINNMVIKKAFSRYQELTFPNNDLNTDDKLAKIDGLELEITDENTVLSLESDESYELFIKSAKALLKAKTVWGALRGLESFSQAVHQNGSSYRIAKNYIKDFPRYSYRGFLLDTARHYIPLPKIFQFLDALAYSKFNVLHWHIVDDNSFPYVSKKFPNLHKAGAFNRKTHIYRPNDVQDVIEYAKLRGIRVMPEFDTPGHTHSWKGQPGLLTKCQRTNEREEYLQDKLGPINPIKEKNYEFLETFFGEVATVFPDEYLHLGGDEVDLTCWGSNSEIQDWLNRSNFSSKSTATLFTYYLKRLVSIVEKLDKKYVVWQDVFDDNVKINSKTIVNVWKDEWKITLNTVTQAGHKAILSACWYLNYIQYGLDWPKFYRCDPEDFGGTSEQMKLVIGGSAAVWGEYIDATNLLSRSFGRGFAVAERLWSSKETKDVKDALKRVWEHQCRYIARGIPAEPVVRSKYCKVEWGMK